MESYKEWNILVPWGRIAVLTFGEPRSPAVLMVHGYMDTAATYIPLATLLSSTHYCIAFDMPGHGKSDPFPDGMPTTQTLQVEAIRQIVRHMKWKNFISINHSMGTLLAVLYNAVYPGEITKMVNLDPTKTFSLFKTVDTNSAYWYYMFFEEYYNKYSSLKTYKPTEYTYEEAVKVFLRGRKTDRKTAELLLTRCLEEVGNGMYYFTWHPSCKRVSNHPVDEETLCDLMAYKPPPMLNTIPKEFDVPDIYKENVKETLTRLRSSLPRFLTVEYLGGHDHHAVQPEDFIDDIVEFLKKDFSKSKL